MRALDSSQLKELEELRAKLTETMAPILELIDTVVVTKNPEHLEGLNMLVFAVLDVLENILDYAAKVAVSAELVSLEYLLESFKDGNYTTDI